MSDRKALLRTVELIYASALAPDAWPHALEAVTDLLGGSHAVVHGAAADKAGPLLAYARIDPRDLEASLTADSAFRAEFAEQCQFPSGAVLRRTSFVSDREFERSAYYNEVVRLIDGFYSVHFCEQNERSESTVTFCRSRHRDDFEHDAIAMVQALRPHFITALEFGRRLRLAETRSTDFALALEHVQAGLILTDAVGQPLYFNAKAAGIVAEADGLMLTHMGLAAAMPPATDKLREAIAALAAPDGEIMLARNGAPAVSEGTRMLIARPSGRPPLLLLLLSLRRLDINFSGAPAPRVAIFIDDDDTGNVIDRDAMADMFRLTARESDIAILLAEGAEPATIARRLGIGIGTVRFHLKHVLAKTETHSQVTLAALVRRFVKRYRGV